MIKLVAVLAEINQAIRDDRPHRFSISYCKVDATWNHKARVRKSGSVHASSKGGGNFGYKVREKGILLLFDELTDSHFSIKISLLTHFNGILIRH